MDKKPNDDGTVLCLLDWVHGTGCGDKLAFEGWGNMAGV